MVYQVVAVVVALIAVIAVLVGAKLLFSQKWILGFLRGCSGFLSIVISCVLIFSAVDIYSYKSAKNQQTIATLSVHHTQGNIFQVEIQETDGNVYSASVVGQQWQLNAQMFRWNPLLGQLGLRVGYRLDSIRGRFLELQLDKIHNERKVEILNSSAFIDVWKYLNENPNPLSPESYLSSPGFIPLADGALFDIVLSGTNISVKPLNDAARSALESW